MAIDTQPSITIHAYRRARRRLWITNEQFDEWVSKTWSDWIPVNADYLINHNVKASVFTEHYIAQWTVGEAVALALSEDNAIKTVVRYQDDFFDGSCDQSDEPSELNDEQRRLLCRSKAKTDAARIVSRLMAKKKITAEQMATELGVTVKYIDRFLSAGRSTTITELSDILFVLGKRIVLNVEDIP